MKLHCVKFGEIQFSDLEVFNLRMCTACVMLGTAANSNWDVSLVYARGGNITMLSGLSLPGILVYLFIGILFSEIVLPVYLKI